MTPTSSRSFQPAWTTLLRLGLSAIVLLVLLIYRVTLGARDITLQTILESFLTFDGFFDHL